MSSVARSTFITLLSLLTVAACLGGVGFAQQNPQAQGQGRQGGAGLDVGTIAVETLHVQGNVYMAVGGPFNAAFSVGEDGVLVVDTMVEPLADKFIAAIQKVAGDKPIRYVIDTHVHADHTGGNIKVAAAGSSIVGGNFAGQVGQAAAESAFIWAHENTLNRMSRADMPPPVAAWPTDTFFTESKELYFNGEAVQLLHQPNAHTDGDVIVFFRKSDVVVAGDVFVTTGFPGFGAQNGGSLNGVIAALNTIIDLTVPKEKQEGGTYVIPGHGRLTDEADVVDYRDMMTIIRDRFQDAIKKGMTLEQVKAARLIRDYEGRYGSTTGVQTTDVFIESAYRSLSQPASSVSQNR